MSAPRWLADMTVERPEGVEATAVVRVLRVPPESAGTRLDVFLSASLRSTSRTRAKRIAQNSAFSPNGQRIKASERLQAEARVVLWRSPVDDADPDLHLPTLYEDESLLVVNKPPHLTVHPTARHFHATVTRILAAQRPDENLHLIHRLDKETSGVLLLARNSESDRAFKRVFEGLAPLPPSLAAKRKARRRAAGLGSMRRQRLVDKSYLAICWGTPPEGLLDQPLEPDVDNPLRVKMRIARPQTGLAASTRVEVIDECRGYSLVRCHLLTGRQHQIRVHLAAVGHAVVGDKLYGPDDRLLAKAADGQLDDDDLRRLELPRHALHAERYALAHAITGEPLEVVAPLAPDLAQFWQSVSGRPPCAG